MRVTVSLASWLLITSLASCSSGLGDFCTSDQDCEPGLHCSATNSERGVCIYPPGALDAAPPDTATTDLGLPDGDAKVDVTLEMGVDAGPDADSSPQDLQPPVEAAPDTQPDSLPDQTLDTLLDQTVDTLSDQTVDTLSDQTVD
jgi:hypothetical protein